MINIRYAIELCLKRVDLNEVLRGNIKYCDITEEQFMTLASAYMNEYTQNELSNMYVTLKDRTVTECYKRYGYLTSSFKNKPLNVFGLILAAVSNMLQTSGKEVLCHYERLMDWRQLTVRLSEDIFTTAFCALEDKNSGKERDNFEWPTVIRNNNYYLRKLLQQELSDNHFHLWASSPHFAVSWLRIMNDTDNSFVRNKLRELNHHKLNVNKAYHSAYAENHFEILHLQAALIRLYLYSWMSGRPIELRKYYIRKRGSRSLEKQLEYSFKPECERALKQLISTGDGCGEWHHELGEVRNDSVWRDISIFIKRLEDEGIYIGKQEEKGSGADISFWNCFLNRLEADGRIPLMVFETVLKKEAYDLFWAECTEETVEDWILNDAKLLLNSSNIQLIINSLKRGLGIEEKPDYILWELSGSRQSSDRIRWELSGERYFLYRLFHKIYQGNQSYVRQLNWFYAYLVIKENFRSEIIQSNDRIGFRNFQEYDRRKGIFLDNSSFENVILKMAIADTLSNPALKHLEVRIVPKDTAEKLAEYIRRIDEARVNINNWQELKKRYYFVCHFTKAPDDTPKEQWKYACRHEKKRFQVMRQADSIAKVRERYPEYGKRILGIDGCSMEIGCRPEVFAQAFRYLKEHTVSKPWKSLSEENQPQIRATYHVGEDFLDITDGLRAIDEAIHFFNLNCGDRLGHALALGLDVKKYYELKHHIIYLPKQDYLDNLAWIYNRIITYQLGGELHTLQTYVEKEFSRYFSEIYGDLSQKHNYNIRTYFDAWRCRGDNPECYKTGHFVPPLYQGGSYEDYSVNSFYPKDYHIRDVEAAVYLYYAYHYDEVVKRRGARKEEIKIPGFWAEGVAVLQKKMQFDIASRGIGIESNPSSNCLISTLEGYDDHPIINWYNNHLTIQRKELDECPQLSVSINTDDKGNFSTSIENEYALMACALEQKKDEKDVPVYKRTMIYEWLDEIRKMGNLQSFHDGGDENA